MFSIEVPALRASIRDRRRNPDLTVGAIDWRPFGPRSSLLPVVITFVFCLSAVAQQIDEAAVERALAERAAAQEAAKAAEQAALEARAQQYVRSMQPIMWRELEFIRQTCDLTKEQRPKIKAAAEKGVQQAAKEMASPRGAGVNTIARAGRTIRSEIAQALAATLTPEQLAKYELEAGQRNTAYRRAAIGTVVALIDDALLLTEEQRGEISKAFETNWQDDWEQWLIYGRYAGRYYPALPERFLVPHLTPEQQQVWLGLTRTSINSWGSQAARNAADDQWWEGK